jgi:glycosidase
MTGGDEPTTRKDFPGGFDGDQRNAFRREGRTDEQQEVFEHVKLVTKLRRELDPLRRGKLINLHVSEQQYAYARKSNAGTVLVVINNYKKPASLDLSVTSTGLTEGSMVMDRLSVIQDVQVANGRLRFAMPARTSAILVPK